MLDEAKLEGKILLGLERGFHVNDSLHQIQLQELIEVSDPSKLSLDLEAIKFFKNSGTLDAELERKGNSIFLKILRLPTVTRNMPRHQLSFLWEMRYMPLRRRVP